MLTTCFSGCILFELYYLAHSACILCCHDALGKNIRTGVSSKLAASVAADRQKALPKYYITKLTAEGSHQVVELSELLAKFTQGFTFFSRGKYVKVSVLDDAIDIATFVSPLLKYSSRSIAVSRALCNCSPTYTVCSRTPEEEIFFICDFVRKSLLN